MREAQDNRASYKSSEHTAAGKQGTIEQAIKVAGPQRKGNTGQWSSLYKKRARTGREAQDNRASHKSSVPTEGRKHRTTKQAIKLAGPQKEGNTRQYSRPYK